MAPYDGLDDPTQITHSPREQEKLSGTPRMLLVDSAPERLEALQSLFDELDGEWELSFALNSEIDERARERSFNGIIYRSHDANPECFAALKAFSVHNPRASKFVLAEESLWESLAHSEHVIHHLAENTVATQQADQVERLLLHDRWMADVGIRELIKRMGKLPTLPTLYTEVTRELNDPEGSMETIADIISKDPSLAAQMLKRVNSSFFSLAQPVTDLKDAVLFLGGERIRSLLLLGSMMIKFDKASCKGFDPDDFLKHSMETATFARAIAQKVTRKAREMDFAYTSGLLHDLGKLLLAANMPDVYSMISDAMKAGNQGMLSTEKELFGITHAEVGGCLLASWGMPTPIVKAVAFHHAPRDSGAQFFAPTVAVHAANGFDHELRIKGCDPEISNVDTDFLSDIGLANQLEDWKETCINL